MTESDPLLSMEKEQPSAASHQHTTERRWRLPCLLIVVALVADALLLYRYREVQSLDPTYESTITEVAAAESASGHRNLLHRNVHYEIELTYPTSPSSMNPPPPPPPPPPVGGGWLLSRPTR